MLDEILGGRRDRVDDLQRRRRRRVVDAVRHNSAVETGAGRAAVEYEQQEAQDCGQYAAGHQTEGRKLLGRENGSFLELEVAETGQNVGKRYRGKDTVQLEDDAQTVR